MAVRLALLASNREIASGELGKLTGVALPGNIYCFVFVLAVANHVLFGLIPAVSTYSFNLSFQLHLGNSEFIATLDS